MGTMGKKLTIRETMRVGLQVGSSETLDELLTERGISAMRQGSVLRWIALWGMFVTVAGREPRSPDDLAMSLGVKARTAYEYQRAFRQAFPEYQTPATVWAMVEREVDVKNAHPVVLAEQVGSVRFAS
jgi:hypothetical protein